jgi:uncharacterized protein YjbI with pentapeptide repeats
MSAEAHEPRRGSRARGRGRRLFGAAVVAVTLTATTGAVSLAGVTSASGANGCTIVSDPTPTNFTNCPGADFSGFDLSAVDLSFANLQGANLQGATLAENICPGGLNCGSTEFATAVQLVGANLQNANLTGVFASCFIIPLAFPRFGGAAANLSGANLSGADLAGTLSCQLPNGPVDTDFSGATLTGANVTSNELIPLIASQVVATSSAGAVVSWSTPGGLPGATPGACAPASGSTFPLGTTTVICQVLDDFGGIATGTKIVNVKLPTTTSLSSSINPTVAGQQVTYTAAVSPAQTDGTVSFEDNAGQPVIPGARRCPFLDQPPAVRPLRAARPVVTTSSQPSAGLTSSGTVSTFSPRS